MPKLRDEEAFILKECAFEPDYFAGIARRSGMDEKECRKIMHKLERAGLLEADKEGHWKTTLKGLKALEEYQTKKMREK